MKRRLVSIIIVNWNGKKHLSRCLRSLVEIKYSNFEVIVVDNGSSDGSVEYIKRNFSQVKIIQNKKNLGFAGGNNIGIKKAKGEYVLFLNNDTEVTPNLLSILIDALEKDDKIAIAQPKIIFMDSNKLQAGGDFLTSSGFLYHYGYGKDPNDPRYNKKMEIFSACGACMVARSDIIRRIGPFDLDFFCYFEESDLCWRVNLAGYKVLYVPDAVVYHKGYGTSHKLASSFVQYHSFKNRICSLIKNLEGPNLIKMLSLNLLFSLAASFAFMIRRKPLVALAIWKAWLWNISHIGKTLDKRRVIQEEMRIVSDKELMAKLKKDPGVKYFFYLFYGLGNYNDLDLSNYH